MALDVVYFPKVSVTVLSVEGDARFLARLLTSDASKLAEGALTRTALLNATGGVLGTALLSRFDATHFAVLFLEENADALEAWARQVSQAFEATVKIEKLQALPFLGDLAGEAPARGCCIKKTKLSLFNRGWMTYAVGCDEAVDELTQKLKTAEARAGDPAMIEALRILAREPAYGLEYDETTSPLEAGLEEALDFEDPARVFIGRALTEARKEKGDFEKLNLVVFNAPFDPAALTELPLIIVGDLGYQPTSLVRIPDMNMTAALVRLPHTVEIGTNLDALVKTEPATAAKSVLVLAPQT